MMANKISEGMEVSVETFYQPDYSNPISGEYMFAYRITIENHNSFAVKLHRRHWQACQVPAPLGGTVRGQTLSESPVSHC